MSIQELRGKFKAFFSNTEYLLAILVIVVSLTSFWLGRLSVTPVLGEPLPLRSPDTPLEATLETPEQLPAALAVPSGGYVASKSGTRYHLPWCPGAKQISETNKVFFATKEEAEAAGYTPAANCKGI